MFWAIYWAVTAFIFGTVVGSFVNVCVWRMPRGESVVRPSSKCPACGHRLRIWPDMIPLLSQLVCRSHCRYCGERFSWRYFGVELLTGAAFVAMTVRYQANLWDMFPSLIWVAALIAIFFIDLEHYIIPDPLTLTAVGAGVVREMGPVIFGGASLQQTIPGTMWTVPVPLSLYGAAICFLAIWTLAALASAICGREAMGSGDALLAAALGAFLVPIRLMAVALVVAVSVGTVAGLAQIVLARRATGGEEEDLSDEATEEGDPLPPLPTASRIGRLLTSVGILLALMAGWLLLRDTGGSAPAGSVWLWAAALAVAAVAIAVGARRWREGDRQWAPLADAAFEAAPGLGPRYLPFGPYLVLGGLVAALFGDSLIQWYLTVSGLSAPGGLPGGMPPGP